MRSNTKITSIEAANAGNARINFMAAVFFWVCAVAVTWWMHASYDISHTIGALLKGLDYYAIFLMIVNDRQ